MNRCIFVGHTLLACAIALGILPVLTSQTATAADSPATTNAEQKTAEKKGVEKETVEPNGSEVARTAHIAELVAQLGDKTYRGRESATRELVAIGVRAKAPLQAALTNPDPEVRARAKRVLGTVLEVDFKNRLDAFIADPQGRHEHNLPGWQRYRQLVGSDATARELFVQMQQSESGLLEAFDLGPQVAADVLEGRCQQLQEMMMGNQPLERQMAPLGSVLAVLFVGSHAHVPLTAQVPATITNFTYQQALQQAMSERGTTEPVRKLLGAWVSRNASGDPSVAYQNLMVALRFDLKEGLAPALALTTAPTLAPHMRQYAVLAVARFGDDKQIPVLEGLLKDETPCSPDQPSGDGSQTQIRDVALAALVHLAGAEMRDFGFDHAQPHTVTVFNPVTLGFRSQQARAEALAHWRHHAAPPPPMAK